MRTGEERFSLVDTNVIVYAVNPLSDHHEPAKALWRSGLTGDAKLCVCPQILFEFYSVVTNPKRFTPTRTIAEAVAEIEMILRSCVSLIFPDPGVVARVLDLVGGTSVKAQEIYDAQLAATMLGNGVDSIYTYNRDHFRRFKGIEVITP